MNISRRGLMRASLQTAAIAASSSALGAPLSYLGMPPKDSILLLSNVQQGRLISAATHTWRSLSLPNVTEQELNESLLFDSEALRNILVQHRGARVVALLDACGDSLLNEAVRDVDGSFLLRGTHAAGASFYLHSLQTSRKTRGCGAALTRAINQPGMNTWVSESCKSPLHKASSSIALNLPQGETPEAIGSALALLAANAWPTDSSPVATAIPNIKAFAITETFMTLIADI